MRAMVPPEDVRRVQSQVIRLRWRPVIQSGEIHKRKRWKSPVRRIGRDAVDAEQSRNVGDVRVEICALVVIPVYSKLHLAEKWPDSPAVADLRVQRALHVA